MQETRDKIRDAVPLELQGFVISAIVVVGIMVVMMLFFRLMRHRWHLEAEDGVAAETVSGKKIKTSNKERQKTRDAARAMGFMTDDVERDVPPAGGLLPDTGEMQRRICARYVLPEHVEHNAEWALLNRPWRLADGDVGAGWQLEWRKGEKSDALMALIKTVTHDNRWKNRFLEIELARNTLAFYWDEFGGRREVENLKSYQDSLKKVAAA